MDNPFDRCSTDSEIMKMVFELSSTGKYTRQQLNVMAARRREEIKGTTPDTSIKLIKIAVPESNVFKSRGLDRSRLMIDMSFQTSGCFEYICKGIVKF